MLISEEKRFLFIHIQKTGGSSISQALGSRIPDLRSFLGKHDHALWGKSHLDSDWSDYYKVAFVRNPWDRLVSWYMMIEQNGQALPWFRRIAKRNSYSRLWQYVLRNSSSFEEFLHKCTDTIDDLDGRKSFMYNQLDYVTDDTGNVIVDFIGRYENFERDTRVVFDNLGLDDLVLPYINRSKHGHYSEYYSEAAKQLVAERYSKDIAFFGYEFEEDPEGGT